MRPGIYIPVAITASDETASAGCAASGLAVEAESPMDEVGFREFYQTTAPRLRAFIYRACGDAALADDLLQDAFYRFLHADLPPFGRRQMKAYLYRTAGSLLADHWRRLKRQRRWSLENFLGGSEPAREQTGGGEAMQLFRRLKPREQSLLWMAYVEGFEHREIAAALHLSEKSVRVLLFRARKKLGEALKKEGFGTS
jgi:RNA polymerase sigma-70 factor (ECF subfamily)